MIKRYAALIFLVLFMFLSGCETTKAIVKGTSYTAEGITKDAKGLWQGIFKLDEWIKENLW